MSTLRDAAKAIVESEQSYGRQCVEARCIWCDANPADQAHGVGCEFGALVRALESETREAIRRCTDCGSTTFDRDGAKALDEAREEGRREAAAYVRSQVGTFHLAGGPVKMVDAALRLIADGIEAIPARSLSTPPPANTENRR